MQLIRQARKSLINYIINLLCDLLQQGQCRCSAGFRGSDGIDRGERSMHITPVTCWDNISHSKGVLLIMHVQYRDLSTSLTTVYDSCLFYKMWIVEQTSVGSTPITTHGRFTHSSLMQSAVIYTAVH